MDSLIRLTVVAASMFAMFQSGSFAEETYVQTVRVPDGATLDEIVELSTKVVPHPRQMDWHKDEFLAFIHWGPNAFTRREWGTGNESPDIFKPTNFDTDQWCEAMKAAGMKRVVLTVKHHDGFCLWPSRYTDHSVASSSWMDGKGDVMGSLSKSCEKFGLKLGVYLSPADLHEIQDGHRYGNRSKYRKETIPTPVKGRPFKDKRTFEFEVDDYNLYFLNQLFELLTEYGPIHEVWFDGAHPKRKGGQTYVRPQWIELIHTLAPNAIIACKGPDARWCGNESGRTRASEFNVLPLYVEEYEDEKWPNLMEPDHASRSQLKGAKWLHYHPAEINTSIRHRWFYQDDEHQKVRSADDVFDIWERSVGGNATFLLNIPPNREGTFSPRDVAALEETGRRIRDTYGNSFATSDGPTEVLDGNEETFWDAGGETGEFVITLAEKQRVNRIMLQEPIFTHGQRIEAHAIDAWIDGDWKEISKAGAIGYKRILRFNAVESAKFRVRITGARASALINRASFHFFDRKPVAVTIKVGKDNMVTLDAGKQKIRYTLDDSDPTAQSTLYQKPIAMPQGGTIKARIDLGKTLGQITRQMIGLPKSKWKLVSASSEHFGNEAIKAFDGDSKTFWHTSWAKGLNGSPKHEHTRIIDLGDTCEISAFSYLPRQDRRDGGVVNRGRIEVSRDGKSWTKAGDFEIDNQLNDPTDRISYFKEPVAGRYFKFVSTSAVRGNPWAGAAEIGVFAK